MHLDHRHKDTIHYNEHIMVIYLEHYMSPRIFCEQSCVRTRFRDSFGCLERARKGYSLYPKPYSGDQH